MPIDKPLYFEKKLKEKGFQMIAGVDEAGRGPLAGPVVAAACILPKNMKISRIDDSKKLSVEKREQLYRWITTYPDLIYAVGIVEAERIDQINILQASLEAMAMAANALQIKPDYLLIDGNKGFSTFCPIKTIVHGDSICTSIAAASIIAKVVRDALMLKYHEKYPLYGFDAHKGYGTQKHLSAIAEHGPCPIHRMSFAPLQQKVEQLQLI